MPNTNALLLVGLGLAALTMFRREESDVDERDLVDASMRSAGTGETGKALDVIPAIGADNPILVAQDTVSQPIADPLSWLQAFFAGLTPEAPAPKNGSEVTPSNNDGDLPNIEKGPDPIITVSPFVQTPTYIRETGDQAGRALRQLGLITDPGAVDLINPKIYVEEITTADGPLTGTENVQIVAGGANPGDPYFTTLDVVAAFRDLGGFDPPTWEREIGPNVFDPIAAAEAQTIMAGPKRTILIDSDAQSTVVVAPIDYATGLDWI